MAVYAGSGPFDCEGDPVPKTETFRNFIHKTFPICLYIPTGLCYNLERNKINMV